MLNGEGAHTTHTVAQHFHTVSPRPVWGVPGGAGSRGSRWSPPLSNALVGEVHSRPLSHREEQEEAFWGNTA